MAVNTHQKYNLSVVERLVVYYLLRGLICDTENYIPLSDCFNSPKQISYHFGYQNANPRFLEGPNTRPFLHPITNDAISWLAMCINIGML